MGSPPTLPVPAASELLSADTCDSGEATLSARKKRGGAARWPILLIVVGGILVSSLLFFEISRLENREPLPFAQVFALHGHHAAWIALLIGLAMTAATAAYLITNRRRSVEVQVLIDKLSAEVSERRESEQRFRWLIESAPDAILTLNPDGALTSMNPAAERTFGRPERQLVSRFFADLVHPEDRSRVLESIDTARSGKRPPLVEVRIPTRTGEPLFMEFAITPELDQDKVRDLLAIGRDISARRLAEQVNSALHVQLRRAQKMEALGRLAGGIAHDFNNFLTTIMANCQIARMDLVHGHPAVSSLDQIQEASQSAAGMVRQILAFSRNQAQERQVLKLEPVVRDALKLLRSMVPVTIHIEPHFDPECPAVLANVEQIHQVILNLGSNAAHAMRKNGGRLEIFQAPVSVDEALAAANPQLRRASYVRLTVRDTGHGMDSTTLDRIFDPFFTTKAPGEGTGLGLAIVHSIMRNHDGAISVSSEPGCGTVFELYFPAVAGIEVRSDADTTVLRKGKGQHVLVVDGDPALADSAKRLIERLGYRATACHSAADALDRFRADPKQFDCVLSDAAVPGLSGLELAAECHHFKPAIPVVLMSGSPSAIGIDSLRSLGIRDFILKPFPLQVLAETLHHSLAATKD